MITSRSLRADIVFTMALKSIFGVPALSPKRPKQRVGHCFQPISRQESYHLFLPHSYGHVSSISIDPCTEVHFAGLGNRCMDASAFIWCATSCSSLTARDKTLALNYCTELEGRLERSMSIFTYLKPQRRPIYNPDVKKLWFNGFWVIVLSTSAVSARRTFYTVLLDTAAFNLCIRPHVVDQLSSFLTGATNTNL